MEDNIISWQEFVDDPTVAANTRLIRKRVISELAKANGFDSPTVLMDRLRLDKDKPNTDPDKLTCYKAARKYVFGLIAPQQENGNGEKRLKIGSVALYRSVLPTFFISTFGEANFSKRTFDTLVKIGDVFVEVEKKAPKPEELKHLLAIANPRDRALLALLATGMRITEAITRKMKEIQQRGEYYYIKLRAGETKAKYKRRVPFTKETYNWIMAYHTDVQSEWIFPSREDATKPMTRNAAWFALKDLFERGGLKDSEDGSEIYSPHSMRKFAENYMLKCGLADKFTDAIIGHVGKLGAKTHYLDDDETTDSWFEVCSDKMVWSQEIVRIVELPKEAKDKMEQLTAENTEIKAGLLHLLGMVQKPNLSVKEQVDEIIKLCEKWSPGTLLGDVADQQAQSLTKQHPSNPDVDKLRKYMLDKRRKVQLPP
jgi:integrase